MKKTISLVLVLALGLASVALAAEDTWTYKADMPSARGFVSGCVAGGRLYVIGGFPTHNSVTSVVEMYDPISDTWTKVANMPSARCGHATCALDGKVYVFGGTSPDPYATAKKTVYVYEIQTDTWTRKADIDWLMADIEQGTLRTNLTLPTNVIRGKTYIGPPLISVTTITDGNWHRIGFVWDGSHRILYVDDVDVARDTIENLESGIAGIYIGAGSHLEKGTFWSGMIDDIRIYNRVKTP